MEKHISGENIIHIMMRYDHEDPHARYDGDHIARMIGETPEWTYRKLHAMRTQGLVSSFQNDGVMWKAL